MQNKLTPATVRALLDRATKGPWVYEYTCIGHTVRQPDGMNAIAVCNGAGNPHSDAILIASAPDLAAAYLEAMAVIERLMEAASGENGDWPAAEEAARAFLGKHKEQEA